MGRLEQELLERTGRDFHEAGILAARQSGWKAVHAIAAQIRPGMNENEGLAIAQETVKSLGSSKIWHRPHVRFGVNTLKSYGSPSDPDVILQPNDLFFIDIGPVFDGYESDAGATFQVGHDPEHQRCIQDGRRIFAAVKAKWSSSQLTGEALYGFAAEQARALGWELTLEEANGHRLSDFPHAIYFKGGISELDFVPSPHRWVLEIQIRHPQRPFGSFHEDLLVDAPPTDPFIP